MLRWAAAMSAVLALGACGREARELGPTPPQTPPAGAEDPRVRFYQQNAFQIAQGGRYFAWYGCQGCHGESAPGRHNFFGNDWHGGGSFEHVFSTIAHRHGPLDYGQHVPDEQLWQLTAFVRDLPKQSVEKRRRQALDQLAEPVGGTWSGPQ